MYVARYVFGSGKYMGLLPRNKLGFLGSFIIQAVL